MGTLLFTCHIEEMWPLSLKTAATSSASAKTQLLLGVQQENRWEWGRGAKKHNYSRYVGNGDLIYL